MKQNVKGVFINSDAWNFWEGNAEDMTEKKIRADVDFYTEAGGVEAICYNMNFQRCFFETKAGTPYWKDLEEREDGTLLLRGEEVKAGRDGQTTSPAYYRELFRNITAMRKNCPDYMRVRYEYCRGKGVEMWHSMRMNDIHWTPIGNEELPQHCDRWREHKEQLRAWYRHTWRSIWNDNAFDYGQDEVYRYHLKLAEEYLLDYESDGIELDWLRSCPVFKPGFDEIMTERLTQFMRDVRQIADRAEEKWGHRIRIAARVPYRVNDAMGMGMDVPAWCREKLIDVLIPSADGTCSEQDAQITLWRMLAPDVILAPCIDYTYSASKGWYVQFKMPLDCALASNYYQQGADTVYFYNHFPRHKRDTSRKVQEIFAVAGDREKTAAAPRRHVVTRHVPCGEGKFEEGTFPPAIWVGCCNGGVKINLGEKTAGRTARVLIGATVPLNIDILVNTQYCLPDPSPVLPAETETEDDVPYRRLLPEKKGVQTYWCSALVPENIIHDGWNVVEIFNHGVDGHTITEDELIWMEVSLA